MSQFKPYLQRGERVKAIPLPYLGETAVYRYCRLGWRGTVLGDPVRGDNHNYAPVRWDNGEETESVPVWAIRRLDLIELLAELA